MDLHTILRWDNHRICMWALCVIVTHRHNTSNVLAGFQAIYDLKLEHVPLVPFPQMHHSDAYSCPSPCLTLCALLPLSCPHPLCWRFRPLQTLLPHDLQYFQHPGHSIFLIHTVGSLREFTDLVPAPRGGETWRAHPHPLQPGRRAAPPGPNPQRSKGCVCAGQWLEGGAWMDVCPRAPTHSGHPRYCASFHTEKKRVVGFSLFVCDMRKTGNYI